MNATLYIETESTIRYDILGYDLLNQRALQDLRTLLIVAIAFVIGFWNIVKNEWKDAMELIGEWVEYVATEVREFDWEIMGEAIADMVTEVSYPVHNVKFYWQQLWVSEGEVFDLEYFEEE